MVQTNRANIINMDKIWYNIDLFLVTSTKHLHMKIQESGGQQKPKRFQNQGMSLLNVIQSLALDS